MTLVPQPVDFPLSERAIKAPDGKTLRGAKARVYHLLRETARRGYRWPVGRFLGPAGKVPLWVLRQPWSGAAAGDRRARDLRGHGYRVNVESFDAGDGEETKTTLYSLGPLASTTGPVHSAPAPSPAASRAPAATEPPPRGPLAGTRVVIVETPVHGALDLHTEADHPFAPPRSDAAAYTDALRTAFVQGQLTPWLGRFDLTFSVSESARQALGYDPAPALLAFFTQLGANAQKGGSA